MPTIPQSPPALNTESALLHGQSLRMALADESVAENKDAFIDRAKDDGSKAPMVPCIFVKGVAIDSPAETAGLHVSWVSDICLSIRLLVPFFRLGI